MRRSLYILADLKDEDLLWLNRNGRLQTLAQGEPLIEIGREVRDLFFVLDGSFDVVIEPARRIAQMAQGDIAGEMSFVERRLPSAHVIAATTATVLGVPRDRMEAAFERDKGFAARFYHAIAVFLSVRLRDASGGGVGQD